MLLGRSWGRRDESSMTQSHGAAPQAFILRVGRAAVPQVFGAVEAAGDQASLDVGEVGLDVETCQGLRKVDQTVVGRPADFNAHGAMCAAALPRLSRTGRTVSVGRVAGGQGPTAGRVGAGVEETWLTA